MALKAYYSDEEFQAIQSHLDSDAVKELGLEFKRDDKGRHVPVVEARDGIALEDVRGLRSAVETTRTELEDARKKAKQWGDLSPENVQELQRKAEAYDSVDPKATEAQMRQKFDEWKSDFQERIDRERKAEVEDLSGKLNQTMAQYVRSQIANEVHAVCSDKAIDASPHLLMPVVRDITDGRIGDDGELEIVVLNPAKPGQPRVGKDGQNMTIRELIADELRQDERYKPAFFANSSSGDGDNTDTRSGGYSGPSKRSEMTTAQSAAYIKEHGGERYRKLPR